MSATISPCTGKLYGIQRVCTVWDVSRSSFYDRKMRQSNSVTPFKRGPKTVVTDEGLLELIRNDLASSLFTSEGHRKVWWRIRFIQGIKVSRKRVLRLMRENKLLSPYRKVQHPGKKHTGKIITTAPNVMWGTDGTKIFTLEDGWCWLFTTVEHWNAECVGWHLTKKGDRFAALQPLSMAVKKRYGSIEADAARGLALRMDNGSQYLSVHFQNQLRYWGIASSFAFVSEPETNGVAERFYRTLKEQIIYGRQYRDIEELRAAVDQFIVRYNNYWPVEKLGFKSPQQAFDEFQMKAAA